MKFDTVLIKTALQPCRIRVSSSSTRKSINGLMVNQYKESCGRNPRLFCCKVFFVLPSR